MDNPESRRSRAVLEETLVDAEAMIGTFNALLDIARAEAGSDRTAFEPVDLATLSRDLAELYGPLAEDKDVTFERTCPADAKVRANRHLLAQAVANLLDNAIKYTPAGGAVRLSVESGPRGPAITVADTGPGIPPGERERVLERFVRLDGDALDLGQRARSQPGQRGREAARRAARARRQPSGPVGSAGVRRAGRRGPSADRRLSRRRGDAPLASAKNAWTARSRRRSGRQASDTVALSSAPARHASAGADRAPAPVRTPRRRRARPAPPRAPPRASRARARPGA